MCIHGLMEEESAWSQCLLLLKKKEKKNEIIMERIYTYLYIIINHMCLHIIYMLCKLFYIIYILTKYRFLFIFIYYIFMHI